MTKNEEKMLRALKMWESFWDDMPKAQLGKIVCDIGLLNAAFVLTRQAIVSMEKEK